MGNPQIDCFSTFVLEHGRTKWGMAGQSGLAVFAVVASNYMGSDSRVNLYGYGYSRSLFGFIYFEGFVVVAFLSF